MVYTTQLARFKYCKNWYLKYNLNKSKTLVFKKGDRLKIEIWIMYDQVIAVHAIKYVGVL
jgi:hypothetical protein